MKVFGQGKFHEKADPSIVFQSKTEGGEEETFSCLNCPSVEFALKEELFFFPDLDDLGPNRQNFKQTYFHGFLR